MNYLDILSKAGIAADKSVTSGSTYENIALWRQWYSGYVKDFHEYKQYNGEKLVPRKRLSLCMAKKVCEDWANLILNEKLAITTENEAATDKVRAVLEDNDFRVRANRLCELAFALGTGAFCEYKDAHGTVKIDFLQADMIYPLSVDGGRIVECAFCSKVTVGGKSCVYVQAHRRENGLYVVENRLFNAETNEEVPLPEGILPRFETGSDVPLFQILEPNVVNNIDTTSPMGISVFANAISALCGVDMIYDSYINEFRLGKKRVYVPVSQAQIIMQQNGTATPIFDDSDTEFYALGDGTVDKLTETDMSIRATEHTEGISTALDVLSDRCGLGTGRYVYRSGGVKTATEVISENSSLYQNLQKHELIVEAAIKGLVRAVLMLLGEDTDTEIKVDFDDSIIHDTGAEFARNLQMISSGLMAKWEFRAWWFGESEEQAKAAVTAIAQDEAILPEE